MFLLTYMYIDDLWLPISLSLSHTHTHTLSLSLSRARVLSYLYTSYHNIILYTDFFHLFYGLRAKRGGPRCNIYTHQKGSIIYKSVSRRSIRSPLTCTGTSNASKFYGLLSSRFLRLQYIFIIFFSVIPCDGRHSIIFLLLSRASLRFPSR